MSTVKCKTVKDLLNVVKKAQFSEQMRQSKIRVRIPDLISEGLTAVYRWAITDARGKYGRIYVHQTTGELAEERDGCLVGLDA